MAPGTCSVLLCVAVCCRVLPRVAEYGSVLQCIPGWCSVLQCVLQSVPCVWQCVAACGHVDMTLAWCSHQSALHLQHTAAHCSVQTLQCATHFNTLLHTPGRLSQNQPYRYFTQKRFSSELTFEIVYLCSRCIVTLALMMMVLQHPGTPCNTLQHPATTSVFTSASPLGDEGPHGTQRALFLSKEPFILSKEPYF